MAVLNVCMLIPGTVALALQRWAFREPARIEVCSEVVRQRAACTYWGNDGVWYLLQAQGGAAVTWTPKPESRADTVVDVFTALRAYVTSPEPVRGPALQTLYAETQALHYLLGLQDRPRSNSKSD